MYICQKAEDWFYEIIISYFQFTIECNYNY